MKGFGEEPAVKSHLVGALRIPAHLIVPVMFLSLLLMTACTVQGPASSGEISKQEAGQKRDAKEITRPRVSELKPVRIDYLRPVEDILDPQIFIYKDKRRLYVMDRGVLVRNYPIGLGNNPKGDKMAEGDGRTPEGRFYICLKNPRSKFYKSLALSYPEKKHAERAFMAGLLSPTQYRDIILALERGVQPPWDTPLGGEIFIHGGGAQGDWTDGCVALYNSDMRELYTMADLGTPVIVRP
ncbi:L,D-transpeptidase family protein [Desulfacinum hydrothermale]|nr:L,D-transpeptidase [Desulfacinum hydrothermale]